MRYLIGLSIGMAISGATYSWKDMLSIALMVGVLENVVKYLTKE